MRVLVVASTFPGSVLDGATPRFVYDLAEAVSAHADVLALTPHREGDARRERMGAVDVHRFRYWWPASAQRLAPGMRERMRASWVARLQVPFFLLSQLWSLVRLVRRRSVDIVNAHWIVPQGVVAAVARSLPGCRFRLVLHVHAGDVYLLARLPFGGVLARWVVSRADRVMAAGSHVRDTLDDLLGRASGARLQPMGFHRSLFQGEGASAPPPEREEFAAGYVIFVGRFVEKKGAIYLIRAFARLYPTHPDLGLVLVGSGPEESVLKREVSELGLKERVRFVGHQPHDAVASYLRHACAAAVPSIIDSRGETEGMPTVVVEAMAVGLPVVGSAVDGIPDLIRHATNGWLCREKDPDDLAEKLLDALAAPPDSPVRRAAGETAASYEWASVGRAYYQALLP